MKHHLARLRRALRKPPGVLLERLVGELRAERERWLAPGLARRFGAEELCRRLEADGIDELWRGLASRPRLGVPESLAHPAFEASRTEILAAAERVLRRRVDLLGSGEIDLGREIDWHRDYKSGRSWPARFHRDIDIAELDRPSDVKFPWELSRAQWLIPAGQAYLLVRDERFAAGVREILESWIDANPYGFGVNWACTMDVALRIVSWSWLFGCFHDSESWRDASFRARFLCSLYLHGRFTIRHLEKSDVNGNHYLADAAGLVFGGLFFAGSREPARWAETGWRILGDELPRQVSEDGVDYEGSIAYHRLVTELLLLPALLRRRHGLEVDAGYRRRLVAMGRFVAAYTRPDGNAPLVGDADDGRVLPLGRQQVNDHRYLVTIIAAAFGGDGALPAAGPAEEALWLLGPEALELLPAAGGEAGSRSTAHGGYHVLANARDHVFVDCARVGLAGRGGHGHNDCLSFEAFLDGCLVVSDAGAYLYTASAEERNLFRSTAYHNTPQIDGQEINRFIRPDFLWNLHEDARPAVERWETAAERDLLVAGHDGYLRLRDPVGIRRTFCLLHASHRLVVRDEFAAAAEHRYRVPLLLAPEVEVRGREESRIRLRCGDRGFQVRWRDPAAWAVDVEDGRVSPSYGVALPAVRLVFARAGRPRPRTRVLEPEQASASGFPDLERLVAVRGG